MASRLVALFPEQNLKETNLTEIPIYRFNHSRFFQGHMTYMILVTCSLKITIFTLVIL